MTNYSNSTIHFSPIFKNGYPWKIISTFSILLTNSKRDSLMNWSPRARSGTSERAEQDEIYVWKAFRATNSNILHSTKSYSHKFRPVIQVVLGTGAFKWKNNARFEISVGENREINIHDGFLSIFSPHLSPLPRPFPHHNWNFEKLYANGIFYNSRVLLKISAQGIFTKISKKWAGPFTRKERKRSCHKIIIHTYIMTYIDGAGLKCEITFKFWIIHIYR